MENTPWYTTGVFLEGLYLVLYQPRYTMWPFFCDLTGMMVSKHNHLQMSFVLFGLHLRPRKQKVWSA